MVDDKQAKKINTEDVDDRLEKADKITPRRRMVNIEKTDESTLMKVESQAGEGGQNLTLEAKSRR